MSFKLAYIGICFALISPPVFSEPQMICASNAGIAQTIQEIRKYETDKDPEHTYEKYREGVSSGYSKSADLPIFIILGDYVYRRFSVEKTPHDVYEAIIEDCLSSYATKKAPKITKEPNYEYEV